MNLKKYFKSGFVYTLSSGLVIVLQMFVLSYLSKVNVELIAILAIIEMSIAVVYSLVFFGGEHYLINFLNKYKSINYFILSLFSMFIFWLVCLILVLAFKEYILQNMNISKNNMTIILFTCFFYTINMLISIYFKYKLEFMKVVVFEKLYLVLFLISILILLFIKFDFNENDVFYISLFISLISFFVGLIILYYNLKEVKSINFNLKDFFILLKKYYSMEGIYFYLTIILILIYERIDQFVVLSFFGMLELSIYYAMFKITFFSRFLSRSINTVLYPYIVNKNSLIDKIQILNFNRKINFTITLFLSIFLIFFSEKIILLIYDKSFLEYKYILEVMALTLLFGVINQININFLNSLNQSNIYFKNALITVSIQCIIIFSFVSSLGLIALVYARLISVVIGNIYISYFMRKFKTKDLSIIITYVITLIYILKDNF